MGKIVSCIQLRMVKKNIIYLVDEHQILAYDSIQVEGKRNFFHEMDVIWDC